MLETLGLLLFLGGVLAGFCLRDYGPPIDLRKEWLDLADPDLQWEEVLYL